MGLSDAIKKLGVMCNVSIKVLDSATMDVVNEYVGHNSATHTMLIGAAHYLKGDGVLNQGHDMLSRYVPRYISLGTMGLQSQDADENGLPAGLGVGESEDEAERLTAYIEQTPGFGADGYNESLNNDRPAFGLGPKYTDSATGCELISDIFPRAPITYRVVLPEEQSEIPETIDVVYSAFISTGALAKFRGANDYLFITETGLWATPEYSASGSGLLAGYRITPNTEAGLDMSVEENRTKLKASILRVGKNQVVQIIWKIQIGVAGTFVYDGTTYRKLIELIELIDGGGPCAGSTSVMWISAGSASDAAGATTIIS